MVSNLPEIIVAMSFLSKNRSLIWCCSVITTASLASSPADAKYFRSDEGVAGTGVGPLPENFEAPRTSVWRVPIDPGHSTPILVNGRIFLTSYRAESKELTTLALDEKDGRTLWRRAVTVERVEQTHQIGSPATATPVIEGQRLFVFFGSYGLICYDLDGKKEWEDRLGPFQDEYGAGSSPIVMDGKVILNQDHDRDSFLAAFDCATGRLVWKTARPDAVRSYSTPAVWQRDGRKELLVAGALELAGYDPANGEKLWWLNG
ncbi:MAG TPA: PQQ-binding-like beta-propeller repeat protein, partial [Candidatus Angelobacter sp.]|nr:PQQ-binding-like beta-propeller repeat protein [Candidatus Angelobacter sp.]